MMPYVCFFTKGMRRCYRLAFAGSIFLAIIVFYSSVNADPLADADTDIIELATLLDGDKYLNEMKAHYVESTFRGVPSFIRDSAMQIRDFSSLPERQQEKLLTNASKRWQEKYITEVNKRLQQESAMLTLYKPYLSTNFTAAEIIQLKQFYSTKLGKKTLQLHAETIRQSRYRFSEELVPVMNAIMEELAKSELESLKLDIDSVAVNKP